MSKQSNNGFSMGTIDTGGIGGQFQRIPVNA